MKRGSILSAVLCAAILLSLCVPAASAAEENYDTFDYRAYANIYPDLKAAYGYDAAKLYAHYVNFGKAEGRIGTFISGDNPKSGAPIYGNTPAPADGTATIPATLLIPLPPKDPAQQPQWRREATFLGDCSNVKVVAEYYSMKSIIDAGQKWDYLTDVTAYYWSYTLTGELNDRYKAVATGNPNYHSFEIGGDVYKRANESNTAILYQWHDYITGQSTFAALPADPGTPGNPPAKTVGGFSDVTEKDYFAQPVLWAVEKSITGGTGNGKFSPGQTCTQAQILTFLWRAKGSPEPAGNTALPGVETSAYYYKAALRAKEQGMIGDDFAAGAPCTRAMAVTYLWSQAGGPNAPAAGFTDVPSGAEYAQAVAWAMSQGIIGGTGNNQFSPAQTCTRGQIVTFLYRLSQGRQRRNAFAGVKAGLIGAPYNCPHGRPCRHAPQCGALGVSLVTPVQCGFDSNFDPEHEKYRRNRRIQVERKASEFGSNEVKEVQTGSNHTLKHSS